MSRVWRDIAIEWFEVWRQEARPYFDNPPIVIQDFVDKTRLILRSDNRNWLELFRRERAKRAIDEVVPIDTVLVAICDLALEDFK
jgi:hypothetical protein